MSGPPLCASPRGLRPLSSPALAIAAALQPAGVFRYDAAGRRRDMAMAGHHHSAAQHDYGRAFAVGIALNLLFVAGEAAAGAISGSLALVADSGHNLADVLSLGLSWGAAVLSRRGPSGRFTYGLRSSSILAALANALILLVVTGGIGWEAVWRIAHPVAVKSGLMIAAAAAGLFVNGTTALLFAAGRRRARHRQRRRRRHRDRDHALAVARSGGESARLGGHCRRHLEPRAQRDRA